MSVKVQVIFYSLYGHIYRLAEAVAEGAREVAGAEVQLVQVAETLPAEILEKMGAVEAKKAFAHIPMADPHSSGRRRRHHPRLADPVRGSHRPDAGVPRRDRRPLGQGALIGKVGSAFTSTASQHGGQETTLIHMHTFFYHQGMVIVGVPYAARNS